MVIVTSSCELGQVPLLIVHLNVADVPGTRPVTPELGELALLIVAIPLTTVQAPAPTVAVLPASVAVLVLQMVWSTPAFDTVGKSYTWMVTSSEEGEQPGAEIVQRSVTEDP